MDAQDREALHCILDRSSIREINEVLDEIVAEIRREVAAEEEGRYCGSFLESRQQDRV